MTTQRRIYRVTSLSLDEINSLLSQLADRLDQIEGYRGDPVFKAEVDMGGNKIINLGTAVEDDDALTKGQVESFNYIPQSLATAADDFLVASGAGSFVKKTLSQVQTILGLAGSIDHGGLTGLGDDDHTQYIKHSLATALSDFLVASGAGTFVKKTLSEVKTILGLGSAAYTASTDYVPQSLATAANDFLVASGVGAYIKKTLAEVKTLIGITDTATIDPGHKHSKLWASDGSPEAITVDASGNVGVGAATPHGNFHIDSGADVSDNFMLGTGSSGADNNTYLTIGRTAAQSGHISIQSFVAGVGYSNYILLQVAGGRVGIGTATPGSVLAVVGLPAYANNAAAVAGGLAAGDFYRTNGDPDLVCVVH